MGTATKPRRNAAKKGEAAKPHPRAKLREMMLHIAARERDNRRFGATKLNKILFYSDFLWYLQTGRSLTGATYQKLDHGPAANELLPAQQSLIRDKSARLESRRFPLGRHTRLVPERRANLRPYYESEEVEFVDEVIEWLSGASATEASAMTHKLLGWRLAEYKENIPFFTALFANGDVAKPSDIKRGLELAKERGWTQATASA